MRAPDEAVASFVMMGVCAISAVLLAGRPSIRAFDEPSMAALVEAQLPSRSDSDARATEEARATAQKLGDALRSLLLSELEEKGFEGAMSACADMAQARTDEVRESTGLGVRRVALRARNPRNTPDAWETKVLEELERLPVEGRAGAERIEVVTEGGHKTLRFLKPLITGTTCLVCHGEAQSIPAEIRTVLAQRYPLDRATGFAEGDLRGGISVRVPIDAH